jgi:hypothetical protein
VTILFFSTEIRRFTIATASCGCVWSFAASQFLSKRLPSYNHRGTDQDLLEGGVLRDKAVPPSESDHADTPPIRVAFKIALSVVDSFDLRQPRPAESSFQTQPITFARSATTRKGVCMGLPPGSARGH